jgi:hypothetical protein
MLNYKDTGGSLHAAMFAGQALSQRVDEGGEGRVYRGTNKTPPSPFSEAGGGVRALDALLQVALTALTAWPGETGLQKVGASVLLPALTRRRALCRAAVNLPSWGRVVEAEAAALAQAEDPGGAAAAAAAGSRSSGIAFPPEIHRGLSEALGRAAEGLNDEAQCREYVAAVMAPAGRVLASGLTLYPKP